MSENDTDFQYGLQHYLDALRLAVEAGRDDESAMGLIGAILDLAPEGEGSATEPTRILVQAMRDLGATIAVSA